MAPNNMTPGQARVIDPILSNHARGYINAEFIGHLLFPIVNIPVRGALVIKFGKESFRKMQTRRAPGSQTKRIQYGYGTDPVALKQDALEGVVPFELMEEAAKVPGIDLGRGAVDQVLDVIALGRECAVADLARNPAKYGVNNKMALVGADKWSEPNSDPGKDVDEAKEQIRRRIGRYPNLFTLSPKVVNVLRRHPKLLEQFKYTTNNTLTLAQIASYFDIEELIVGKAVMLEENASDDADAQDVWGDDAILSFKPKGSDYRMPSFGYTYRLTGHPMVEQPYNERNAKSWVYPVTEDWSPELTGMDAGFLFQSPV